MKPRTKRTVCVGRSGAGHCNYIWRPEEMDSQDLNDVERILTNTENTFNYVKTRPHQPLLMMQMILGNLDSLRDALKPLTEDLDFDNSPDYERICDLSARCCRLGHEVDGFYEELYDETTPVDTWEIPKTWETQ